MSELLIQYGHVQVHDNVLPRELYNELLLSTRRIGWQWGWNTPSNRDSRYWHHEVGRGRKANTEDVSAFVRQHPVAAYARYMDWLRTHLVPADTKVLRFYLNGHTFGTDGWPHTDTDRGEELTGVLYLNLEWKPEWCGETVVFDGNGDIEAAVLPRANRLLTFPSDRVHAPRPLSKAFDGLRVVLVVKMASPSGRGADFTRGVDPEEARHLQLLERLSANDASHSGRSLAQHLRGTYRLLTQRGADPDVRLAGLFHSIYGTSIYKVPSTSDRDAIRAQIGERAERLAWLFCTLQRPQCWSAGGRRLPTTDGGTVEVTEQELRDLRTIERANLDEQGILKAERMPAG